MLKFVLVACVASLTLSACSEPPAAKPFDEATATPVQNYNIKEGKEYGYTLALSDEDKKSGKGSADIVMFRYLGEKDGVYTLQPVDAPDMHMVCTNPCQYVKAIVNGRIAARTEFVSQTIIGEAFIDAFNNELEVF